MRISEGKSITLCNTLYLPKAIDKLEETEEVNELYMKHISPLGWEHINFIGQYTFDDNCDYDLVNNMRPLKAI